MPATKKNLYNNIIDVIEPTNIIPTYNTVVRGFVDAPRRPDNEKFMLRKFSKGPIYVFEKLYNSNVYDRKEAFDILGSCFLTHAVKKKSDLKKYGHISEEVMESLYLDLIKIWKSETSPYFVLCKELETAAQK